MSRRDRRHRPPERVLTAFGASGDLAPVPGGRGLAWRASELLVKPADGSPQELEWQATALATVPQESFRLSFPERAKDGALVVDGWTVWSFLPGEHRTSRWLDVIAVGDRFHEALAGLARPAFIAARTDPWAIGDRVAWGEAPIDPYLGVPHVVRLAALRRPVDARSQLIHGDLTGNVLFSDELPPAVIDLSMYWRPTAFATAIVVADALVWEGADGSLLDSVVGADHIDQMLIKALLYRLVAAIEGGFEGDHAAIERRYRQAVDLACHRIDTSTT